MLGFYISMECQNCEEDIFVGPCGTTIERDGLPVVPFDFASIETFTCDRCDAKHYTADFRDFVEVMGGRDVGDEEDEDDEDDD